MVAIASDGVWGRDDALHAPRASRPISPKATKHGALTRGRDVLTEMDRGGPAG